MPEGGFLMNLVTYDKVPVPVTLVMPAGAIATDLISGATFGPNFILPPHQSLLLKVNTP
mgnify:CR=1 FL=1